MWSAHEHEMGPPSMPPSMGPPSGGGAFGGGGGFIGSSGGGGGFVGIGGGHHHGGHNHGIGHHHYGHGYGREYDRYWRYQREQMEAEQERIRVHNNMVAMSQIKFEPPQGAPEGGAWIDEKYVGIKTKGVMCCLFFCVCCFACLLLKYPLDERRVYVVAGADGKRQRYDLQGNLLPD